VATPPRYQRQYRLGVATDTPEALASAFVAAVATGDIRTAADLWLDDAKIIQPDGQAIEGRDAVIGALQALVDGGIRLEIDLARVFVAGDVAVVLGTLTLSGTSDEGEPFTQASKSSVVYLRGPDGWRIAIDSPWGLPTSD
jgi:uncharacterized protein (TIGR02246 family)